MLILFIINIVSGILLIKIKELYILIISILCVGVSSVFLLFLIPWFIENNFWFFFIYTVAIGLLPAALVSYINARIELINRQKLISKILFICFLVLILTFHFIFLQNEIQFIINIILSGIQIFFLTYIIKVESKTEIKEGSKNELKSISFAELLLLISPIFIFFVTLFISNLIYVSYMSNIELNTYLFDMRRISELNFLPFLIGSIVAFMISGTGEYLGRKFLIFLSFGLIGFNWISSSIIGPTIIVTFLNGLAYGLMVTVGILTISGDIIFKSHEKMKPILISLFLAPIFLYELLTSYFFYDIAISYNWLFVRIEEDFNWNAYALLLLGFSYDWIFFALQLNLIRNTLFSLMIGLYILSIILVVYSPETFPIKKKQEYLIDKYILKAKEMAEKQ
ncbi:MAG: hypothetical protein ACFFDN_08155 [Candidatus Hodarchaeota archaeon]